MVHKIEKANSVLQKELSEIIYREIELSDIYISISRVLTAADLGVARVFINCLPEEKEEEALKILIKNRKLVKEKLSGKIKARRIPELIFLIDEEEKEGAKSREVVEEILKTQNGLWVDTFCLIILMLFPILRI